MPKIKKIWIIVISIALFLIITNPNVKRFKEYGKEGTRKYNFLLFSIFENTVYPEGILTLGHHYPTEYHLGIALNFFKLKEE